MIYEDLFFFLERGDRFLLFKFLLVGSGFLIFLIFWFLFYRGSI